MKKVLLLMMIMLACTSEPVFSSSKFTGLMDMVLTMPNGTGKVSYYFGTGEQRMDMIMQLKKIPDPLKTTVITKASRPDEAIIVNHQVKSYSFVNLRTAAENATLLDFDSNYTLQKLGKVIVKGYQCDHIALTSTTEKLELWVTRDLGDFSTFRLLQTQNPRLSNTSLSRTLKNEAVDGFPVKIVQKNQNGLYIMELVQISPKSIPSSEFSIPSGYKKVTSNIKPLGTSEKAHLRELMEKMKKFEK
ncbi:MAG: DUF4412 domain-containing protein [Chlorobiaceae bacterium]|jgi:hypothetical protein|nr:DUF4412 domain-containing protein [Chlorobiaceae bacterium]NTW62598.1 DUF4412 domain-containing protein [Chlorobiaceae bacterium]